MTRQFLICTVALGSTAVSVFGQATQSDSSKINNPSIGIQVTTWIPQILELPFFSSSHFVNPDGTLSDDKIHTFYQTRSPKIHYIAGLSIKHKKHGVIANIIFRPKVYGGGMPIQTHPTKYAL